MTTPTAVDREALRLGAFMPPWLLPLDIDPTRAIRGQLETVEYLERIGFAEAWIGEHHSGGFEIISSPELFIAAAASARAHPARHGRHLAAVPQPARWWRTASSSSTTWRTAARCSARARACCRPTR